MKKIYIFLLVVSLGCQQKSYAELSDVLESSSSAAQYFLGYIPSVDKLDLMVTAFRSSVKAWYATQHFFGYQSYEDLQKGFLYPPDGAIPPSIKEQLVEFNNITIGTAITSEEVPLHRNDNDLGTFEKEFISHRLTHIRKSFTVHDNTDLHITPDTNLHTISTPYGYALDTPLHENADVPRIAVCYSGGGFRAMIATLGFWKGLSDTGLVDSILYTSNLSGSTWCSMPWSMGASLEELENTYEKYAKVGVGSSTISDLKQYIAPGINKSYLSNKLTSTFLWDQPLSSVRGLYGPLLAQMTLSSWDDPLINKGTKNQSSQYLYLWQAKEFIANKNGELETFAPYTTRPFPIATGLIPYEGNFSASIDVIKKNQQQQNGLWMEFNPEYVGFEYLDKNKELTGAWIPTFGLGRKFEAIGDPNQSFWSRVFSGKKIIAYASKPAFCHTVDYWEGAWGSAFTVSPGDLYRIFFGQKVSGDTTADQLTTDEASLSSKIISIFGNIATTPLQNKITGNIKNLRLFPAKFNNFAIFSDSPIKSDTFTVVDAGIDFNLPIPPLLRPGRAVDLIIIGDWSEQKSVPAKELLLAERWAIIRKIPFPRISGSSNYPGVETRAMTLFNEYPKDTTGPAILYVPLINNAFNTKVFSVDDCFKGACSTFNFDYRNQNDPNNSYVKQLSNHTYRTVWGIYPQVREVVQELVKAKNSNEALTIRKLSAPDALIKGGNAMRS